MNKIKRKQEWKWLEFVKWNNRPRIIAVQVQVPIFSELKSELQMSVVPRNMLLFIVAVHALLELIKARFFASKQITNV